MNIRSALNSLPGRPGVVIAVVLAVIVLAAFYVQPISNLYGYRYAAGRAL